MPDGRDARGGAACHAPSMRRLQAVRDLTLKASGLAVLFLGGCAGGDLRTADEGVYCYRTLADTTCFVRPVPHNQDQLLGYAGPTPPRPAPRMLGQALDLPPPRGGRDSDPESISR